MDMLLKVGVICVIVPERVFFADLVHSFVFVCFFYPEGVASLFLHVVVSSLQVRELCVDYVS